MKVSKAWLKELVDLKVPIEEVQRLLPLRTIATKEITDRFIELDMKGYNRADLLSMRGVAYEVAAITDSKIKFTEPEEEDYVWSNFAKATLDKSNNIKVMVENRGLTPLYCAVKIIGLRVEPSESEWVEKLADSGIRSVNNVIDVTNLVMLDYGQPMHAFDNAKVKSQKSKVKIVVRNAQQGEKIITLDGKTRELSSDDLVIADNLKILGIAGVMGGKESEVSDQTTSILLEAAIFDPVNLRRTAMSLGLQSEASKRFYHGLTKIRLLQALDSAIRKYQQLGAKLEALTIIGDFKDVDRDIVLTHEKVNSLIGVEIKKEFIEEALSKLNFEVSRTVIPTETGSNGSPTGSGMTKEGLGMTTNHWKVMPPYWRKDVEIEEDLIEEVARMYGYEKIPAKPLAGDLPEKVDQTFFENVGKLKVELVNLGLTEVQTYSFFSTAILKNLGWDKYPENLIKVANPISSETEYLRHDLWPNLVEVIGNNLRHGIDDIAIFEIGRAYLSIDEDRPKEEERLAIALSDNSKGELQEVYSILMKAEEKLNLKLEIIKSQPQGVTVDLFHPARYFRVSLNGKSVGGLAEVHPRLLQKFGIGRRVAVLELAIF